MTDLRHLRIVIAVAEGGSFTAAANERNADVSAISRAVHDLEQAPRFLQPYTTSREAIPRLTSDLARLTRDNPRQRANLAGLHDD